MVTATTRLAENRLTKYFEADSEADLAKLLAKFGGERRKEIWDRETSQKALPEKSTYQLIPISTTADDKTEEDDDDDDDDFLKEPEFYMSRVGSTPDNSDAEDSNESSKNRASPAAAIRKPRAKAKSKVKPQPSLASRIRRPAVSFPL